ncbi:MAG: hypothetical protein C0483_17975 [Pirellula sp.]|nr:hypothetical protein [Pirellula sp.]
MPMNTGLLRSARSTRLMGQAITVAMDSMATTVTILAELLMVWGAIQAVMALIYLAIFHATVGRTAALKPKKALPSAAILLSLRGADDELPISLHRFMSQDYPNYELHIVVDSKNDPAWKVVQEATAAHPSASVIVTTLAERPATCSPHCASLCQAAESAQACEVVALADGDVVANPAWLRTLVTALDDERVGMAHGNRWYLPEDAGWGSLVRYLWNTAAVVGMYFFHIPWGGSSAMRTRDMREAGILEAWRTTLNQDNPVKVCLQRINKQVRFVPLLMMPNRDAISLSVCREFLARQLTWTRIYNPRLIWVLLVLHGWGTTAVQFLLLLVGVVAALQGDVAIAGVAAATLGGYLLFCFVMILALEHASRRVIRLQGGATSWVTLTAFRRFPAAIFLTQWVYCAALFSASFRRRITWRSVTYEMHGPWKNSVVRDLAVVSASNETHRRTKARV